MKNNLVLSCQPRVTASSCFVYNVIRDLLSIYHLCINPIHRIELIHNCRDQYIEDIYENICRIHAQIQKRGFGLSPAYPFLRPSYGLIHNFIRPHKLLFQHTFHILLNTIIFRKYLHVFHIVVYVIKMYNSNDKAVLNTVLKL